MTDRDFKLRDAFPTMPEHCRAALINAARSVKEEEEPMKRKFTAAIVLAALLTLTTTIAIAEGWNVLAFLGLQPDSDAQTLVQPVTASAKTGNVTVTVNSAITDGEFLIFDWTIRNEAPDTPVYVYLDGVTANGRIPLIDIGSSQLSNRWLPDRDEGNTLQGGYVTSLSEWIQDEDVLHMDVKLSLYTPIKPVRRIDAYNITEVTALQEEGYIVIVDKRPENLLTPGSEFDTQTRQLVFPGTQRSEITLSFDVDLKAAKVALKTPARPAPAYWSYTRLSLETFTVSPLQIRITAAATWADNTPAGLSGKFILRDKEGNTIKVKTVSDSPETFAKTYGRDDPFSNKATVWECAIIAPNSAMPEEADLIFRLNDGSEISLPLTFR